MPQGLRRTIAAVTGFGLCVLALSSCSKNSEQQSSSKGAVASIRVADYYTDEPNKSIVGDVLLSCGEQAGVQIEREGVPAQQLISKTLQQINTKTLPDIQMLDAADLPQIAVTGALSPLSNRGIAADNVAESVKQMGVFEDQVYGIAPTISSVILYYNKTMLDEAGIEPPATWAEMKEAAIRLTNDDTYGIAFSAINDAQAPWQWMPFFWSAGAVETDLDSPEAISALQLWVDLVDSGSASASVVNWGNSDVGDQFVEGRAAMMINSGTQMAKLDGNPDLDYGTTLIPAETEGGEHVSILGGEVWTLPVTGDTAREEKAAEVLSCLTSSESQLELALKRRTIPADPELKESFLKELPQMEAYFEQVQNARSRTALLGEEWSKTASAIWTAIQSAVTGQATPEQALATAADSQHE